MQLGNLNMYTYLNKQGSSKDYLLHLSEDFTSYQQQVLLNILKNDLNH